MLNRIIVIGRLVADVQLRYTQNGVAVASFTVAVDRPKYGDREKETDYLDVVVWRKLAELCAEHIGKGRLVAVEGRLQIRSYDDNNGIRRKAAEIVADNVRFLDSKKGESGQAEQGSDNAGYSAGSAGFDDVPFSCMR